MFSRHSGSEWGTFVKKSDFSPLKVENTFSTFAKNEQNFFSFLEELDYFEA